MARPNFTDSAHFIGVSLFCLRPHTKNILGLEDERRSLLGEGFGSVPPALLDAMGRVQVNPLWNDEEWRRLVYTIWPRVLFCEFLTLNRGGRLRKMSPSTCEVGEIMYVLPIFVKGLPESPDHEYCSDDALVYEEFPVEWDEEVQLEFYGDTFPTVVGSFTRYSLMESVVHFISTLNGSKRKYRLSIGHMPFFSYHFPAAILVGQLCPFSCSVHVQWGEDDRDNCDGIMTTQTFMSRCDIRGEHHSNGCPDGTREERHLVFSWVRRYVRECEMGVQPVTVGDLLQAITGSPRYLVPCHGDEDWFEVTTVDNTSAPQGTGAGEELIKFCPDDSVMFVQIPCNTYTEFACRTTDAIIQSKLV